MPLVIPEINGDDAKLHRGIIANPNCTTAVALMAIYPLHRVFNVQRVFAASYQAVSGSGARAIAELKEQVGAAAESRPTRRKCIRTLSRSTCCRTSMYSWKVVTPRKK